MAQKQENGFTIIEVLIVLAIAGLILLIVFIAVPALQRNGRNTQRKRDLSSFYAAIIEYQSNNNIQRAPFTVGSGENGDISQSAFTQFRNRYLSDDQFDKYEIHAVGPFTDHDITPERDEIIYFPWHYCQDGTGDEEETVIGQSHDSFNYSIMVGSEGGTFNSEDHICRDNGPDRSDAYADD